MDIKNIEDEIENFCDGYFKDEINIIDDNKNFIDTNNLYQPKENYTLLYELLNSLLNQIKDVDYDTLSSAVFKLDRDIKFLFQTLKLLEKKTENFEDIFLKKMIPKSEIFTIIQTKILEIKNAENISHEDKITLKQNQTTLKQIYPIYYTVFHPIFYKKRYFYRLELLKILNTKLYYIDKLIWIDIEKSDNFKQRLRMLNHQQEMGTQAYIIHKLEVVLPYSKEFKYLQNCLKVFK